MRPDTPLTFIAPSSRGEQELFGGHSRQGGQEKRCSHVGNCVHGKWVSETHVFWGQERDSGTRNCAGHSRFVFCVNTYQCVISFSSQYCKSKQRGTGEEVVGGSAVARGALKWFS